MRVLRRHDDQLEALHVKCPERVLEGSLLRDKQHVECEGEPSNRRLCGVETERETSPEVKENRPTFSPTRKATPNLVGIFGNHPPISLLQTNTDDLNGGKKFVARPSQPRK